MRTSIGLRTNERGGKKKPVIPGGGATGGVSYDMMLIWLSEYYEFTPVWSLSNVEVANYVVGNYARLTLTLSGIPTSYNTLLTAEMIADETPTFATGALAPGAYTAQAFILASDGTTVLETSNPTSKTLVDDIAPVISAPVDTLVLGLSTTIGITTDTAEGTWYYVLSSSSTAPTAAQIIAGQMHTGAAAAMAGSYAVTASGAQSKSINAPAYSTTYYMHATHRDVALNASNVVSGDGFTTGAASPLTYVNFATVSRASSSSNATININTGTYSGNKKLVVVFCDYGNTNKPTLSIGGIGTFTKHVQNTLGASPGEGIAIYELNGVPQGAQSITANPGGVALGDIYLAYYICDESLTFATRSDWRNRDSGGVTSPEYLFDGSSGNGVGTQSMPASGFMVAGAITEGSATPTISGMTNDHSALFTGTSKTFRVCFASASADADPGVTYQTGAGYAAALAAWNP